MNPISRRKAIALIGLGGFALQFPFACSFNQSKMESGNQEPLHYLTIAEISKMIKSKEISCVALTQMMLDRIDVVDAKLHSFINIMKQSALAKALALDNEIASGEYRGPLHGVPIAVKDLCYTKGVATMGGLKVLSDFVPDFNATVVSKLEEAGAVLLGKLNLTEGAMVGYHRDFKIPLNPWGEDLWAGVSSSGSGVATAAGLCFASIGTDTGGSIRFPAMANGIVGLKPTYGRVSRYGILPLAESLDHVGPMTRSVEDAAIVFETIAGLDPNDPTSLTAPVPDMLKELDKGVVGLRIGFDRAYAMDGVEPGLARSIENAVGELERLGAKIVDVKIPDLTDALATWSVICAAEAAEAHREHFPSRADEYGEYFREFLDFGMHVSETDLAHARQIRSDFSHHFRSILSSVDAVISPAAHIPFPIPSGLQYGSMTQWNQTHLEIIRSIGNSKRPTSFTFPHNFAGTPALALRCGFSDKGLPYTMQLAGSHLNEAMLCRIGHAYEKATGWHQRHPPV